MTRDYACGMLHVPCDATGDDIKHAFRIEARKNHPDQNPDSNAARHFNLLKECYDFLVNSSQNYEKPKYTSAKTYRRMYTASHNKLLKDEFKIGIAVVIVFIVISAIVYSNNEQNTMIEDNNISIKKSDFIEGQGVDANGNGTPDFIVRNSRFIGTVSGKDFGPATLTNLNARRTTTPIPTPAPTPAPTPTSIKPQKIPTAVSSLQYTSYSYFKNYAHYPVRQFLDATGWSLSSNRSHELPEDIKNKIRNIGDYLHDHYTYGSYKAVDGIGQDDDKVFDCDDFAGLMYRMGRDAGLEMYIIDLPGHWANAVRYGNTLYTIEPQGINVKYRNTSKFGNLTVAEYARYTEQIVVER